MLTPETLAMLKRLYQEHARLNAGLATDLATLALLKRLTGGR